MDIVPMNPEANREKVKRWAGHVIKEEQPDLLVLPEMWTTAYTLPELDQVADREGEPTTSFLRELAHTYGVNIIGGSIANRKGGKFYNTAVVVDRSGTVVYQYDKIHLVPMLNEHHYLEGGKEKVEVFELDGVKMGLIICYDLRFPELARKLALEGAQVLHIVAEWPAARREHWKALQVARAIENQMYVLSCNRIGAYDDVEFAGTSMIIDPWGDVVAAGSKENEETIIADVSFSEVPRVRKEVPIFKSRVPDLY